MTEDCVCLKDATIFGLNITGDKEPESIPTDIFPGFRTRVGILDSRIMAKSQMQIGEGSFQLRNAVVHLKPHE